MVDNLQCFVDIFDSVHHMPSNTIITGIHDSVDKHYKAEPLPHYHVKSSYAYAQIPSNDVSKERRSFCQIFDSNESCISPELNDSGSYNRFEELTRENPTIDSTQRSSTEFSTDIL